MDGSLLDALNDYIKRQRKRLGIQSEAAETEEQTDSQKADSQA
jgi:hypothetical protein